MIDREEHELGRWAQGLTSRSRLVLSIAAMPCSGFAIAHLPSVVDRSFDVFANCMSAASVVVQLLVQRVGKHA